MKHPRTEPRPGSRADVASDLPETKARNPPCKHTGTERGYRQGEQTKGWGRCTTLNTTTHKHASEDTRRHTRARETRQGPFIHSFFIFTAPSVRLFAGIVGLPMSMSVAIGRARLATCRKHTVSKQGTAQHKDERHGSLLHPEQSEPSRRKSEDDL